MSDSERTGHEDVDVEIPQGSHLEFFLDLKLKQKQNTVRKINNYKTA